MLIVWLITALYGLVGRGHHAKLAVDLGRPGARRHHDIPAAAGQRLPRPSGPPAATILAVGVSTAIVGGPPFRKFSSGYLASGGMSIVICQQ